MKAYLQYHAYDVIDIWTKIKASPEGKSGHTGNTRANAYKAMLDIKMQREGKRQISMPDAINYIEKVSSKTLINIFCKEDSVYVNEKGGCRDTQIRNDDRIHEQIFEICNRKDLVWPTTKTPFEDVKITRWPSSPHFYLSVNGKNSS